MINYKKILEESGLYVKPSEVMVITRELLAQNGYQHLESLPNCCIGIIIPPGYKLLNLPQRNAVPNALYLSASWQNELQALNEFGMAVANYNWSFISDVGSTTNWYYWNPIIVPTEGV